MGGLQPWHLLLLLVVLAAIVAAIAGVILAILKATNRSQPTTPVAGSTPAPGWYPDPNDPTALRYFDGRTWVTDGRPPQG